MILRHPAHRAARPAQLPRVASLGLVAATAASPFAAAVPAMAAPGAALPSSPLVTTPLPATPLPAEPVATTPVATTPLPTTPPRTTSTLTRWVTAGSNVRSGPGTGYAVVGGLSAGAKVTGSYTSNGWFELGSGRFVAGSLLTATDPDGGGTPAPPSTQTRWVTVGSNVRSGPGTSYPVVGGLSAGTEVTGSMTSNGWFDMGDGRFVAGSLLTATDPGGSTPSPPADPTPPSQDQTRWITAGVNVRSGPGTQYSVVGALTQGTEVSGAYTSNNWFDIGNGRFVAGWLVTDVPPGDGPAPAPPPGAVTGAMVLTEAARYIGVPYLWGGSTPAGFDCSGFTSYVFGQLGISLPRTAAQQQAAFPRVYDPRPGDLVFSGYPAYHVGIYAGNNTMWDSARPGTVVQLRQIWDSGDISYGRVPGVAH